VPIKYNHVDLDVIALSYSNMLVVLVLLALILPRPSKGFILAVLVLLALTLSRPSEGFVYPFLLHGQDINLHSYSLYLFDCLQNLDVMATSSICMKYIVLILILS